MWSRSFVNLPRFWFEVWKLYCRINRICGGSIFVVFVGSPSLQIDILNENFRKSFLTETENRFIYEITSPGICKKPAIHEIGPPKFKWFHSSLQVFIFKKLIGGILGKIKKYYTMVNKCSVFLRHCHNKGIRYLILFSIEVICENWVYSLLLILQ